jgi:hypothetical protein
MTTNFRRLSLAACLLAGCTVVEKTDPRPGGLAWTNNKAVSWFSEPTGARAGIHAWRFVQVVAPAGSSECWVEGSPFDGVNPYPKAPVDAGRAALVSVRNERSRYTFACRTPEGVARRTVTSEKATSSYRGGSKTYTHSYWITPPLVHIDPADAEASTRWDKLRAEICPPGKPGPSPACEDRLDRMKRRDLQADAR